MGAAVADYDNDGDPDLFVPGVGQPTLYRNLGNGRFEDVTAAAGIAPSAWSVAAAWTDVDKDGRLDLFVVNYLDWNDKADRFCGDRVRDLRVYCHPKFYAGLSNQLYRNRGDGTFEDISRSSGIAAHVGKGMSVGVADFDADGRDDLFVTNDGVPNFLFRNVDGKRFEETALLAGVALPGFGRPVSSMGVAVAGRHRRRAPGRARHRPEGRDVPVVRQRRRDDVPRRHAPGAARRAEQPAQRLGRGARRPGQRWPARHRHGQFARQRPHRSVRGIELQGAQHDPAAIVATASRM